MVYSVDDIKHLEMMKDLEDRALPEVNVKTLLGIDAAPQSSFDQSILKLCQELRTKGFERHAVSLENKFIALKTAKVHLYRAHDEDGEDLVHSAHPDGDVNMGDGELGDVETTVSKHKKIVDIVNKQPTGKLASYITQCKMVLGQDVSPAKPITLEEALENMRKIAYAMAQKIDKTVENDGGLNWYGSEGPYKLAMHDLLSLLEQQPIHIPNIDNAIQSAGIVANAIMGRFNPIGGISVGPIQSGVSKKIQSAIAPAYTNMKNALLRMRDLAGKILEKETTVNNKVAPESEPTEMLLDPDQQTSAIASLTAKLNDLKSKYTAKAATMKLTPAQQQPMLKWFTDEEKEVREIRTQKDVEARTSEIDGVAAQVQ